MNARRPRRPLLGAAVFAAAGAAWGGSGPAAALGPGPVAAALAVSAAAYAALRLAPWRIRASRPAATAATAALFAAVFSLFALESARRTAGRMETVELFREALDSREAAFSGRVAGPPSVVALKHGGARLSFDLVPASIVMECDSIPVPDRGLKVRVEWYGPVSMGSDRPPFPIPGEGEGWLIEGRLREIPVRGPVPRVAVSLRGGGGGYARREPALDAGPVGTALRDIRRAASRALGRGVASGDAGLALVRAMVLGERADIPESVSAAFRASGTIHVFAISGLHVAVIAGVLAFFLRRARLPLVASFAVLTASLAFYVALTGGRPSAVRAFAMAAFAAGAPLAGRRPDAFLSLAGALLLLLAADPLQSRDAGFVFSFLCTAAVVALAGPLTERWNARFSAPRAAAARFASRVAAWPGCRWFLCRLGFLRRGGRVAAAWIWSIPPVSLAAWLASAPLTAALFGRVSPVSVLCNVAVLPLALVAICAALAALALAALLPAPVCAALPAGRTAALAASAMAKCAAFAASVPGASFETEPWPPFVVAAWFAALLALCAWLHRNR